MDFEISLGLQKELKRIKAHDKKLTEKIVKQLVLFQENHLHPSLRVHKLSGNLKNIWSISIDKSFRMLYFFDENGAYFFDIGTHNQVYKK